MTRLVQWINRTPDRRIALALILLVAMVYIPLAGNYGAWDPWETHYGEVARQMLERHDFVSQYWPGSPQDRTEFWSKPVLTFWLMALGMKAFGIERAGSSESQIADSWRAEWGIRLPMVLLALLGVWAVWELTRRLVGRRAGVLAAVILATSSQWVLIARQAMTDMPFVVPMTVALMLAGLAILLPDEEREAALPRRERRIAGRTVSWPHAPQFYGFALLFAIVSLVQILMITAQLGFVPLSIPLGKVRLTTYSFLPMLIYFAAFAVAFTWSLRATNKRQLYLMSAWVLCGVASLAKGPAGLAMPAIVLGLYLTLAGRWREIFTHLELGRGALLFVSTAFPWYHAMLIRHGVGFWQEFIGDNYVHRAGGRHGDRGTFEYYLQYIGYGMFPWSGLVALGGMLSFSRLRDASARAKLTAFALTWFVAEFTIVSAVNTKFHHYILPALPALAILTGLFVDELLSSAKKYAVELLLVAAPLTFLCGRDLAAFPPRILWMFNYDYVNAPGTGRPWPMTSLYGDRYEYGTEILIITILATLLTAMLGWWRSGDEAATQEEAAPAQSMLFAALGAFVVAIGVSIALGPSTPEGAAPKPGKWAWLAPTALMLPFVVLLARALGIKLWQTARRTAVLWTLVAFGVVWSAYLVDKIFVELSPHWSQKHALAAYYKERKSADEPLIAWMLYWRGENFYTRNLVYRASDQKEKTVFIGDRNSEKLQTYITGHRGRRMFFIVERTRFETLRGILPQEARASLKIVDESNNKLYLAVANL